MATLIRAGLIALVALVPAVLQLLLYKDTLLDDPFITFRYAQHLVQGHGLVWNPGEKPVEGFTSFGWTMLSALGIQLGVHPLAFAKAVGVLAVVGLMLAPLTRLNAVNRTWTGRAVAAVLIGACPLLAFYAMSGMEHILFAWVVFVGLLVYMRSLESDRRDRDAYVAMAIFGLAGMIRPEGLGVFGIVWLYEAFRATASGALALAAPRLGLLAAAFSVVWLPFFVWRFGYFGYPFPNTYYAKHTGGGLMQWALGVKYLLSGAHLYLVAPLAFALGALGANGRSDRDRERAPAFGAVPFMVWFLVAYLGYIVLVGGDDTSAFPSVRFFVPVLPVAYLLAARGVERIRRPLAAALVLVALVVAGYFSDIQRFIAINGPVLAFDKGLVAGLHGLTLARQSGYEAPVLSRWIRERVGPEGTIAVPWAGAVAYYSQVRVVDMLGLNDEHIAHLPKRQHGIDVKMDPDYILARKPDLIFINVDREVALGKKTAEAGGAWRLGDRELIEKLKHNPAYRLVTDAPTHVIVYERVR